MISGFSVSVQGSCGLLGLLRTSVLVWASTDGTSATLGLLDGVAASVPPSGSVTRCALLGQVYLLTVRGDGGVDQASLTIAL